MRSSSLASLWTNNKTKSQRKITYPKSHRLLVADLKLGSITFGKKLFPGESETDGLWGQGVFLLPGTESGKCGRISTHGKLEDV